MRRLVIGDIHGAKKALDQVLDRCNYNPSEDKIIFLGDYVDGWSESAEVIDTLIEMKLRGDNLIFIKGNHDRWCQEWLNLGNAPNIWTSQGGKATIDSYIKNELLTNQLHKQFFNDLVDYHIEDDNKAFVHGGYLSNKGLGHEEYVADYYWDRSLWERQAMAGHKSQTLPKKLAKHDEIFIGHTSTTYYKEDHPMNKCNVWNVDTGAGWDGKLTILDIDTKEYWQSDFVKELYPNEKGR